MLWPDKINTTKERRLATPLSCVAALGLVALAGCSDSNGECGGNIPLPESGSRGSVTTIGDQPVWVVADMKRDEEGSTLRRVEISNQPDLNQQLREHLWQADTEPIETTINDVPVRITTSDASISLVCLDI